MTLPSRSLLVRDAKLRSLSLTQEGQHRLLAALISRGVEFKSAQREGRSPDIQDLWEDEVPWGQMMVTALKVRPAALPAWLSPYCRCANIYFIKHNCCRSRIQKVLQVRLKKLEKCACIAQGNVSSTPFVDVL